MYFSNYKNFPNAVINPSLLWEYNIGKVDLYKTLICFRA